MKHKYLQTELKFFFVILIIFNSLSSLLCYNDLETKGIARAFLKQQIPSGENFEELNDPIIFNTDEIVVTASLSLAELETPNSVNNMRDYDKVDELFFYIN